MEVKDRENSLYLPNGIITNIFKRLPAKSLIRFQCVSKHWENIVKSPDFIKEHLHHSIKNETPNHVFNQVGANPLHLFMADCEMRGLDVCELSPFGYEPLLSIIGTCNGLICVKFTYSALCYSNIFLWNPAIREVRQVSRVFHDCCYYFGFGFCPIVNDYKIVKISDTRAMSMKVYSLNTNSWREIGFENIRGDIDGLAVFYRGAYVNGSIFWYVRKGCTGRDTVVSFNTTTEVFTSIPVPASVIFSPYGYGYKFVGHDNKVFLVQIGIIGEYKSKYDVWVMEEGVDSSDKKWVWTKIDDSSPYWSNLSTQASTMLGCGCDDDDDFLRFYVESLLHTYSGVICDEG